MDKLTFKKTLTSVLADNGFRRKGNSYNKDGQEVYCVIGLQKSNYANSYYINTGFFIKELQPDVTTAKSTDGHITERFSAYGFGEATDDFDLDLIGETETEKLKQCFMQTLLILLMEVCLFRD